MTADDPRNALTISPGSGEGVTQAMLDAACGRIARAGGALAIWAVLREDAYETRYGDGLFLHLAAVALNEADAQRLAALAAPSEWVKWHVRELALGLGGALPTLRSPWRREDEFTLGDLVRILAELAPGDSASRLHTGSGRRDAGPSLSLG